MSSRNYYKQSILKQFIVLLLILIFNLPLIGAERMPTISSDSYAEIVKIQKFLDDKKFSAGLKLSHQYLNKKTSSDYERAIGLGLKGQLLYGNGQLNESIAIYREILTLREIPEVLRSNSHLILCQLMAANREYDEALTEISKLQKGALESHDVLTVLESHIHLMQGNYPIALKAILRVVRKNRAEGIVPKEDWLQILYTCYFHTEKYFEMVKIIEELNESYPKREYAHRLADSYGLTGQNQSRLIILEALNDIEPLAKTTDIKALVNLYLSSGAPYKAAKLLNNALEREILKPSEQNLVLLGNAWMEAKETSLAIEPFARAASLSSHGNLHLRIAQIYIDEEKWLDASNWVKKGIGKGHLNSVADANIMLGIILLNQQKLADSKLAFIKAIDTGERTFLASRWLKYIDRL
jgi:hypothetical protein